MITTHSLSVSSFLELAEGGGDSVVVSELRGAQLSKHMMLLHVVAEAAAEVHPSTRATDAFRVGYRLLSQVQAADQATAARLLALPHIGSWAHDCLASLDNGLSADFGYLAAVAASAAIQAGLRFEVDVPVRDGRAPLPGLGCLEVPGAPEWIKLTSDGARLRAGEHVDIALTALIPDAGSGVTTAHWRGAPLVKAEADGQTWAVLLEIADRYLDRYALPMLTALPEAEVAQWRDRIQGAWELLVRHHQWAAGPVAEGVSVIVPLVQQSDLDSATSPAAFGAIATSLPPTPVSMAETLVHEFQHNKLCGLMDMLPLIEATDERGYAPWREDPRPMAGLLQGVYAFAGIVHFWDVQRHVETGPDEILRANVLYERWRSTIATVTGTLLDAGALTSAGVRFITALRGRPEDVASGPAPAEAIAVAREIALDNWLTWQLRHTAADRAGVARLADAFQRGEPLGDQALPATWIEDDTRKVDSIARSRLLKMSYEEPRRYRELSEVDIPGLRPADALLIQGNPVAAVAAYRLELAAEPDPAAWIGLALAIHRLSASPARSPLATQLPLICETHLRLASQGVCADPLELAAWFA